MAGRWRNGIARERRVSTATRDRSPDMEAALVGAFVISPREDRDALDRARGIVRPEHITDPRLRVVYAACERIRDAGAWPDVVSLGHELAERGELDAAGGYDTLSALVDGVPHAANVEHHARLLADLAARRRYREALTLAVRDLDEPGAPDLHTLIAHHHERVGNVRPGEAANLDAWATLAELMERADLMEPPGEVVPYLGHRGRTTGLVGPAMGGKSSLAGEAVKELSRGGYFLGQPVQRGYAVVCAPDEAPGDTVRRLVEAGADPERVRVLVGHPTDLLGSLDALLRSNPTDLVVVDSLAEWARLVAGQAPDDGDSAGWGAVLRPLVALSRVHNVAIIVLHHPRRSDGQYRGSGEIAAALDCLLEMRLPGPGEDPTLRYITGRARWRVEPFSIRLDEGRYVLGSGGVLPLESRVLMDLGANPGTTRADSFRRIKGNKSAHVAAVNRLLDRGGIVERGGRLYLASQVEEELVA